MAQPDDNPRVMRGLDIGVNDYLVRPVDRNELAARVRTQIRRKRYADRLRNNVQHSLEMAVTDPLTSLHNRRYFEAHAAAALEQAVQRSRPLSLLILDIDHFKAINDSWGHDAGDEVLREFAHRVRKNLRGIDLPCRIGGEEFVVVMPDTDMGIAAIVAERVRRKIERELFVDQRWRAFDRRDGFDRGGLAAECRRNPLVTASSVPTKRCIAPRTMAAIAWLPTRPESTWLTSLK